MVIMQNVLSSMESLKAVKVTTLNDSSDDRPVSEKIFALNISTMKQNYLHSDEIFITGCARICQNDNFWWSQLWNLHQNDKIAVSE